MTKFEIIALVDKLDSEMKSDAERVQVPKQIIYKFADMSDGVKEVIRIVYSAGYYIGANKLATKIYNSLS